MAPIFPLIASLNLYVYINSVLKERYRPTNDIKSKPTGVRITARNLTSSRFVLTMVIIIVIELLYFIVVSAAVAIV